MILGHVVSLVIYCLIKGKSLCFDCTTATATYYSLQQPYNNRSFATASSSSSQSSNKTYNCSDAGINSEARGELYNGKSCVVKVSLNNYLSRGSILYILTIIVDLQTPANKLCAIKLLFNVERWDYIEIIHFVGIPIIYLHLQYIIFFPYCIINLLSITYTNYKHVYFIGHQQ